ncbi:cysteine hydrolase family protein [Streptomyces fulvoviolaceus]|uniref:cysteine hydrolase family protein n=1 Tax=Streptomyces fulvoviolaceus TaxID=285535 RepID=UPI0004C8D2FD|nr:isochorismatase family cysteine hydrolase [Streptomyces fulvoviolaceus]
MELDPRRTTVLAIHCQGDIVGPDGAYASFFREQIDAHNTLGVIGSVIRAARAAAVPVIFTRVAFAADYANLNPSNALLASASEMGCLLDGSPQAEIVEELGVESGDEMLTHQRVGAFAGTDLHERLQARGIDTLVLTGVATNMSVETTARYASELGYRTILVGDAMTATTQAAHDATLASMAMLAEVAASDDVITALRSVTAEPV